MSGEKIYLTIAVDAHEFEEIVRGALKEMGVTSFTPKAPRAKEDKQQRYYCSNPTCSNEISKKVYEFRDQWVKLPLCFKCQALVRERESGEVAKPPCEA